ncbi:hypothetical protein [Catenulispora pinisilvae]|uniref:hypothetical protein n=1 Tax=Catenulispora pinisilvae TaxID=2705253 RepID=UPI001890DCDA|nr:hypothetical protein [Catenulispora pinisilvae]
MTAITIVLRGVAAVGLAVDAYVHLHLAHRYDPIASSVISQGTLFRIEAAAAILALLLVVLWRHRAADAFAWLTAAAGLAAILIYRYANPGAIGPLPNMYEPIWYADKVWALIGQAAAIAALTPLIIRPRWTRADASKGEP